MMKFYGARHSLTQSFDYQWMGTGEMQLDVKVDCGPRSNVNRIINGTLCSVILGAVEKMPWYRANFLKYLYGNWDFKCPPGIGYEAIATKWVEAEYVTGLDAKTLKPSTMTIIGRMARYAVEDYRFRITNKKPKFSDKEIKLLIGLDDGQKSNWLKSYEPHWTGMLQKIDELDKMSLAPISALVAQINEQLNDQAEVASRPIVPIHCHFCHGDDIKRTMNWVDGKSAYFCNGCWHTSYI